MAENETLRRIERNQQRARRQSAISFGIALVFMGLTILPTELSFIPALTAGIIFGILGIAIMSSPWWLR